MGILDELQRHVDKRMDNVKDEFANELKTTNKNLVDIKSTLDNILKELKIMNKK